MSQLLAGRNSNKADLTSGVGLAGVKNEAASFIKTANLLGLLQKDPDEWFKGGVDTNKFDSLVAEYDQVRATAVAAKAAGDKAAMGAAFGRSDDIRDELKAQGIVIETGPDGSSWRKA